MMCLFCEITASPSFPDAWNHTLFFFFIVEGKEGGAQWGIAIEGIS